MHLYPRYVKMADGSKVFVQGPLEHAALTGVAKGESAKALAGVREEEPEVVELDIPSRPVKKSGPPPDHLARKK